MNGFQVINPKLTALEEQLISIMGDRAGVAATVLAAWAKLHPESMQTVNSLTNLAQLGTGDERAVEQVLNNAVGLGLINKKGSQYSAVEEKFGSFDRLALLLNTSAFYAREVHEDATSARIVLTKPRQPSVLERNLSNYGWHTAELDSTHTALIGMVQGAKQRIVLMTPFLDSAGAERVKGLFEMAAENVEKILILRSLEDDTRYDYPKGYDSIREWLHGKNINILNYSLKRAGSYTRETFHAKVVLCDRSNAYLGSSNMTAASFDYSMEMGVIINGKAVEKVATIIDAVIDSTRI